MVACESTIEAVQRAASAIGLIVDVFSAGSNREIDTAFRDLVKKRFEGVLVNGSPLFNNRRLQLAGLAARHVMPVIYYDRVFPEAGGLMSYGSNIVDQYRQGRTLCRPRPQRRKAGRPAGDAADQVRAHNQSADCANA